MLVQVAARGQSPILIDWFKFGMGIFFFIMRAKLINGIVKIDNDAMDVTRTIQVLKDGVKGESSILSGLDKAIQALYRAGYQSEASNAEDVKRNAKSIFTFMKKEIDWLQ